MSKHPTPQPWPTLQRADAERVLRRAIEIEERRGEWIDAAELRRIAAESGVDPRSVTLALAEVPVAPARRRKQATVAPAPAGTAPGQTALASVLDFMLALALVSALIGGLLALGTALVSLLATGGLGDPDPLPYWLLVAGVLGTVTFIVLDERRR